MNKKYCRVMVTNIVSDEMIELAKDLYTHKVICDCTIEGSEFTEKGVCRIFSNEEYEDVLNHGFYYIEDLTDAEQEN